MRKYIYLAIFLFGLVCGFGLCLIETRANTTDTNNIDTALSQLEDRFFEHQYDYDTDNDRLNRIEEFVFGSPQTGSPKTRVKNILSTIPKDDNTQNNSATPAADSNNQSTSQTSSSENSKPAAKPSSPKNPTFDYGSYPRVTNLEQELLGHTYPADSLTDRLNRLETKAYGAPSNSNELCQRVDLLDDYAERHDLYGEHRTVASSPATAMTFNSTTPVDPNSSQDDSSTDPTYPWKASAQPTYSSRSGTFIGSPEERVSMMEAQVFHHTSPDKPLDVRLKKLAKKIMPDKDIANLPPAQQTVRLWDTLHPTEKDQVATLIADADQAANTDTASTDQASPAPTKHGSWLHRLATAGSSFAGTSTGPNSGMQTTYGTNAPFYGAGMPGYGNPNSHYIGASVGPGAGPAGLPIGFW